jgi:hypothetical protein
MSNQNAAATPNQGPAAALTMMNHMLLKEASELLCEAVQDSKVYFDNCL